MAKELKLLIEADSQFLSKARAAETRATRHFVFTPGDNDLITIVVCGRIHGNGLIAKSTFVGVDCPDCLAKLIHLAQVENYKEARDFVAGYAETIVQPDGNVMKQKILGKFTVDAVEHLHALHFLQQNKIPSADKIVENIIGTDKETFYANLVGMELVDENGETIQGTVDWLQRRIDGVPEPVPEETFFVQ